MCKVRFLAWTCHSFLARRGRENDMKNNEGPTSTEIIVPKDNGDEHEESSSIVETTESTREKKFGGDKPEFKRPIECLITAASFKTDGIRVLIKKDKNGKESSLSEDQQYTKHWLQCTFEYVDKESKEKRSFDQTFGNIREYDDRLWSGTSNNLAQLKGLLEEYISVPIESIWDLAKELVGKKCTVKSKTWQYGKNSGFSNLVQDFVDEEGAK